MAPDTRLEKLQSLGYPTVKTARSYDDLILTHCNRMMDGRTDTPLIAQCCMHIHSGSTTKRIDRG